MRFRLLSDYPIEGGRVVIHPPFEWEMPWPMAIASAIVAGESTSVDYFAKYGSVPIPEPYPPATVMPLDTEAADQLARWWPDHLHMIRPGPGVTVRPIGAGTADAEPAIEVARANAERIARELSKSSKGTSTTTEQKGN